MHVNNYYEKTLRRLKGEKIIFTPQIIEKLPLKTKESIKEIQKKQSLKHMNSLEKFLFHPKLDKDFSNKSINDSKNNSKKFILIVNNSIEYSQILFYSKNKFQHSNVCSQVIILLKQNIYNLLNLKNIWMSFLISSILFSLIFLILFDPNRKNDLVFKEYISQKQHSYFLIVFTFLILGATQNYLCFFYSKKSLLFFETQNMCNFGCIWMSYHIVQLLISFIPLLLNSILLFYGIFLSENQHLKSLMLFYFLIINVYCIQGFSIGFLFAILKKNKDIGLYSLQIIFFFFIFLSGYFGLRESFLLADILSYISPTRYLLKSLVLCDIIFLKIDQKAYESIWIVDTKAFMIKKENLINEFYIEVFASLGLSLIIHIIGIVILKVTRRERQINILVDKKINENKKFESFDEFKTQLDN